MTAIVRQNIFDLQKLLINTKRINEDNQSYIEHVKSDVQRLGDTQGKNIDKGFEEVIQKLVAKRETLKHDFQARYNTEVQKYDAKLL